MNSAARTTQLRIARIQAIRLLWHDARNSPAMRLVLTAVCVAVAACSAVGFFIDSVQRGMRGGTAQLLGADLIVRAAIHPVPTELEQTARAAGLGTTRALNFLTTLPHGEAFQLTRVKAVERNYPLRGRLWTSAETDALQTTPRSRGPAQGEAWPDSQLAQTLNLQVGDTLQLGTLSLRIGAILVREPGHGRLFRVAPQLLMHLDDTPRTGLGQIGSRVYHQLLVSGPPHALQRWRKNLDDYPELTTLSIDKQEQTGLHEGLNDVRHLLGLCAYLTLLLAGLAIAMASALHARQRQDTWALLRCLGVERSRLMKWQLGQLLGLALIGGILGGAMGYICHYLLAGLISEVLKVTPAQPSVRPLVTGMGIALLMLIGFSLPRLATLAKIPPLRILQRNLPVPTPPTLLLYGAIAAACLLLAPWRGARPELLLYLLPGLAAGATLLLILIFIGLRLAATVRARPGSAWRHGLANLRRGNETGRVLGLALGLCTLFLLYLCRTDLLEAFSERLPPGAPNYFLVDIQEKDRKPLEAFLNQGLGQTPHFYLMTRARLTAINDRPIQPLEHPEQSSARHLSEHQFGLVRDTLLPSENRISAGRWHGEAAPQQPPEISMEAEAAEALNVQLGDRLSFLGLRTFTGRVSSLREVRWDNFLPNFYVIGGRGWLEEEPYTYITAFHVPQNRLDFPAELKRNFPELTVLDIAHMLEQSRSIMQRLSRALEFLFSFSLLAGLLVLYTALLATRDERHREVSLLRVLGAGHDWLRRAALAEFCCLGMVTGSAAGLAAAIGAWSTGRYLFQLPITFNMAMPAAGALLGALLVTTAGLLATRGLTKTPPLEILRRF